MENGQPLHRVYHFTDVPVLDNEKYTDGQTGRSKHDIVHLIPICIRVLKDNLQMDKDTKITQAVAIILLAHFLGPLHVGAEYFAANGKPTDPDKGGEAFADKGGNGLTFSPLKAGKSNEKPSALRAAQVEMWKQKA